MEDKDINIVIDECIKNNSKILDLSFCRFDKIPDKLFNYIDYGVKIKSSKIKKRK